MLSETKGSMEKSYFSEMKKLLLILFVCSPFFGFSQIIKQVPVSDSVLIDGIKYKLIEDGKAFFAIKNNGDSLYYMTEKIADFPGGQNNLFHFLGTNIVYPGTAKVKNIQGKVYVNFIIDKTGFIKNINIIKGVDPLLDDEALRVIKTMPKWSPAEHNGQKVSSIYNLPISFTMKDGGGRLTSPGTPMKYKSSSDYTPTDNRGKGHKYLDEGDYEKAIYYFSKIIKVQKDDSALLYYRGIAYHKNGDSKKAKKDLIKAEELGSKEAGEYLKTIE